MGVVDAEVVFDLRADRVEEGDVFAAVVGPALVEAIRGNEDGAVVGEALEAVVRVAAAVDGVHVTTQPVQTEDELVLAAALVALGNAEDVLTLLAIDGDGLLATGQSGILSTAGCASSHCSFEEGKEEQCAQGKD